MKIFFASEIPGPAFSISPIVKQFPNCPLCKYEVRNTKANSSPNDVILTFQGGHPKDIYPFFRSLRTTSCQATLIFFVSDILIPMALNEPFFRDCGIEVHPVEIVRPENCSFFYHHYRFTLFYHYLCDHSSIKRAFITDLDAIFQGDPFTEDISDTKSLYFLEQYTCYVDSSLDRVWADAFYNSSRGDLPVRKYGERYVVNCGSIIGSRDAMILCTKAFVERSIEANKTCTMGEQGIAANIAHNGEFEAQGISVNFFNSGVALYGFGLNILNMLKSTELGNLAPPGNKSRHYLYLHAYAANPKVRTSVMEKCPSTGIYDFVRD